MSDLEQCPEHIQLRMVWHTWHCDPDYGKRVAEGAGVDLGKAKALPPLEASRRRVRTVAARPTPTACSRRRSEGADSAALIRTLDGGSRHATQVSKSCGAHLRRMDSRKKCLDDVRRTRRLCDPSALASLEDDGRAGYLSPRPHRRHSPRGTQGEYSPGSSSAEGFIHCAYAHQVQSVADTLFGDSPELTLLEIDPALVTSRITEDAASTSERFPHIYGPLAMSAVVTVRELKRGFDGRFSMPCTVTGNCACKRDA